MPKTKRRDLIEKANEVVSIFDVLHDLFDIDHPREGRSYKGHCPFGFEHPDGGVEKGFRSYPGSNTGYCFVMHGQLTPVRLVALQNDWSQRRSAEWLLRKAGKLDARPWQERWNEMEAEKAAPKEQELGDPQELVEALHESLRSHPAYPPGGLSPRLSEALETRLRVLERVLATGFTTKEFVEDWYRETKDLLRRVLDEEEAARAKAG
jgi:hypothetical protein